MSVRDQQGPASLLKSSSEEEGEKSLERIPRNTSRASLQGTVFYHVEDIVDDSAYAPWSTGVSRIQSRDHSPQRATLRHSPVGQNPKHNFNAARIPLDFTDSLLSAKSEEEILERAHKSDLEAPGSGQIAQNYELQSDLPEFLEGEEKAAILEDDPLSEDFLEQLEGSVADRATGTQLLEQDQEPNVPDVLEERKDMPSDFSTTTYLPGESYDFFSQVGPGHDKEFEDPEPLGEIDSIQETFAAESNEFDELFRIPDKELTLSSLGEEATLQLDVPVDLEEDLFADEASFLATLQQQSTPEEEQATLPKLSVDANLPDISDFERELNMEDNLDFDVDAELEKHFQELDASLGENSTTGSTTANQSRAREPSIYSPAHTQQISVVDNVTKSPYSTAPYQPYLMPISKAPAPMVDVMPNKKQSSSFITAKTGYSSPYDLPDSIVGKRKTSRPTTINSRSVTPSGVSHPAPPSHGNYQNVTAPPPPAGKINYHGSVHASPPASRGSSEHSGNVLGIRDSTNPISQQYSTPPVRTLSGTPGTSVGIDSNKQYSPLQSAPVSSQTRLPASHYQTSMPSLYPHNQTDNSPYMPQSHNGRAAFAIANTSVNNYTNNPISMASYGDGSANQGHTAPSMPDNVRQVSADYSEQSDSPVKDKYSAFLSHRQTEEQEILYQGYGVAHEDIHAAQQIQRRDSVLSISRPASAASSGPPMRRFGNNFTSRNAELIRPPSRALTDPHLGIELTNTTSRPALSTATNNKSFQAPTMSRTTSYSTPYASSVRPLSPSVPTLYQNHPNSHQIQNKNSDMDQSRAHPIAVFGIKGHLSTVIPQSTQSFGHYSSTQVSVRQVKNISTSGLIEDYPGPLNFGSSSTKTRRKDILAWLDVNIGNLSNTGNFVSEGKCELYQILKLSVEASGQINTDAFRNSVAAIVLPELAQEQEENELDGFTIAANILNQVESDDKDVLVSSTFTQATLEKLASLLVRGKREAALRLACEKKLWAHAMVIASRISSNAWTDVVKEFTQHDLKHPSQAAVSLGFVYKAFATVQDSHPLPSSDSGTDWRRALAMIVNNKGPADELTLIQLANQLLLANHTYAAHICYLLCDKPALFSGPETVGGLFTLLGCHNSDMASWTTELDESLVLSEIYEYTCSLANPKHIGFPHLQAYKLRRAYVLAENGMLSIARRYSDAVNTSLGKFSKIPGQVTPFLLSKAKELSDRLDESPSEGSESTWLKKSISRPKMDNLFSKFSEFVAGESNETSAATKDESTGPFGKIAMTPALSRQHSNLDMRQPPHAGPYAAYSANSTFPFEPEASHISTQAQNLGVNSYSLVNTGPYQAVNRTDSSSIPQLSHSSNAHGSSVGRPQSASLYRENQHAYDVSVSMSQNYTPSDLHNGALSPEAVSSPFSQVQDRPNEANTGSILATSPQQEGTKLTSEKHDLGVQKTQAEDSFARAMREQAEADAAKEKEKAEKSSWLGGWFKGKKEKESSNSEPKVHKANLGEGMALIFDEKTKRWVKKDGSALENAAAAAPPPPPKRNAQPAISNVITNQQSTPPMSTTTTTDLKPASADLAGNTALPPSATAKKAINAEDDLAAMLTGPVRSRPGSTRPSGIVPGQESGTMRKPARKGKKYVDVFGAS